MEILGASETIPHIEGWVASDDNTAIRKTFQFQDFKAAWAFMSGSALKAEQMDHHPEWFNVYNRVEVTLTTHDAANVTTKDLELAVYMDQLSSGLHASAL